MTQKTARFLCALILTCLGGDGIASGQGEFLRIEALDRTGVTSREQEVKLFIGADFNGWNPAGTTHAGYLEENGERIGWYFEIPREMVEHGGEFKFTRGGWGTVECSSEGRPIENRRTGPIDWNAEGNPVLRFEVMAFENMSGSRRLHEGSTVSGGRLEVHVLKAEALGGEQRTVRVWVPEAYDEEPDRTFGVFYFHDGQNVFDARTSAFGTEWGADEAAAVLINEKTIEPRILVGIDNSGANRSRDYLPFPPGERARGMAGGGADDYVSFLVDEVMQFVAERYRVRGGPEDTGIGGSSFGGVVTLHAVMSRPGVFGQALIESPSLWVGDGKLMEQIESFDHDWPNRVFLAMGDAETGDEANNARLVELTHRTSEILAKQGLGEDRLMTVIGPGQRHNEQAWQERLPGALRFLLDANKKSAE